MKLLLFILISGLCISLIKYRKNNKNLNELKEFVEIVNKNLENKDIMTLCLSMDEHRYRYNLLIKEPVFVENWNQLFRPVDYLYNLAKWQDDNFFNGEIQFGINALIKEILINISRYDFLGEKKYVELFNPFYWILNFFSYIFEKFLCLFIVPINCSKISSFLGKIATFITTIIATDNFLYEKFNFNIIKLFQDIYSSFQK